MEAKTLDIWSKITNRNEPTLVPRGTQTRRMSVNGAVLARLPGERIWMTREQIDDVRRRDVNGN